MRVILVSHGIGGDVRPFIKMGRRLVQEGHQVICFSHCVYQEEVTANGIEFVALDNQEEYEEMSKRLVQLTDPIKDLNGYRSYHVTFYGRERLERECRLISSYCVEENTIIVYRHRYSVSALLAAEMMHCPAICIFLAPNFIQHMGIHEELIGEAMKEEVNQARKRLGLACIPEWTAWMCSSKVNAGVWPSWYAKEETEQIPGMQAIGFHGDAKETEMEYADQVKEFLEKHDKIVLITAGTSKMIHKEFYHLSTEACIKLGLNTILVTPFDEFVLDNLPPNILHVTFVPIKQLLKHCALVINHGGIGITSESIASGVPQLLLPHVTDGPDNAERIVKFGGAVSLPEASWSVERIMEKMKVLLSPEVLKNCKELQEKSNRENAADSLVQIIKKVERNYHEYCQNSNERIEPMFGQNHLEKQEELKKEEKQNISAEKRAKLMAILKQKNKKERSR